MLQLVPIASHPVTVHLQDHTGPVFSILSRNIDTHSNEFLLTFSVYDLANPALSLSSDDMFQALGHLGGPLLDSFQYANGFLALRNPKLDEVLHMWSYECQMQRNSHFP